MADLLSYSPPPAPPPPDDGEDTSAVFLSGLIVNLIVGVVVIIIWQILRNKKWAQVTYTPKKMLQDQVTDANLEQDPKSGGQLYDPNPSLFGVIKQLWTMPEEEFVEKAGLDAAVFVRVLSFSTRLFCYFFIIGVVVAIVNITADNLSGEEDTWNNAASMANIPEEDARLWVHAFSAWFFTAVWGWLLIKYHREVLALRNRNMSNAAGIDAYTVLVQEIPTDQKDVPGYFRAMYGSLVSAVIPVEPGIAKVHKVYAKAAAACEAVENLLAHKAEIEADPSDPKLQKQLPKVLENLTKENAKLTEFKAKLAAEQDAARGRQASDGSKAAFVTFKTRAAASAAVRTLSHVDASKYVIRAAGKPSEIVWETGSVENGFWKIKVLTGLAVAITVFIVFFNFIPVTLIQGLANEVPQYLPEPLASLCGGFLPGIGLIIFLILVPPVFRAVTKFQGVVFVREQDKGVSHKFFIFLIFCVFLGTSVSGAIIDQFDTIKDDFKIDPILDAMGTSIPKTADFFITFVLIKGLVGHPLFLLDIGKVIVHQLKLKFLAKTAKAKSEVWAPIPCEFDIKGPDNLLVFMIGMSFSTIAPFSLPWIVLYNVIGTIVYKYKLLYMNRQLFESEGQMWPHYTRRMFWGVLIYQLVLTLIMSAKKGPPGAVMFPLIVLTVIFNKLVNDKFKPAYQVIPRDVSCTLDTDVDFDAEDVDMEASPYFPPCMKDVGYLVPKDAGFTAKV